MAESAVTYLLDKLVPVLKKGSRLMTDVRDEVDYIVSELECIKAFLGAADAKEESDPELKVWVKQVREVAYDMEDIIDDFRLCNSTPQHLRDGFLGSIQKIARFRKDFKAHSQLASEIQSIKSRVHNISEAHHRYRYKFNSLEQGSSHATASNAWYDSRGDALLVEEAELVGIDNPRKELIEMLLEGGSRLKVVSVVGMGGLGKTTLVKKVHDDMQVKKTFQCRAWITVSQSFKIEELLRDLIKQLCNESKTPTPQGVEMMNGDRLKAAINELLQRKRYLIIFDDIWSIFAWEAVKYALPNSNCGSRIMLTTRHTHIANSSCIESDGFVFNMEALPPRESWTLFCSKAFRGKACPPPLEKLSRSILRRCEGLPLAITAIGGLLATKDKNRIDEWEIVDRSLNSELESNDKLERLNKVLSLSFNDLPYYLKYCFLYLSIFPEDHPIECMRLIRLWMAEEFVVPKEGKTLEEVAESYLKDLINRSLIQIAQRAVDGSIKTCRVHDLMRQIILSKSRDQNFATVAGGRKTMQPKKARRLSVHDNLGNIQQGNGFTQVRSLLMFGIISPCNSDIYALFGGGPSLLRVLDLRGLPIDKFPNGIVDLYHLKYLSLRRTKVKILPSSIGKLQNLQTLDLKETFVSELPAEIFKLQQLRHLLVYRYVIESYITFHSKEGFKAQGGIGKLQSLQKLCFLEADQGEDIIKEFATLNELRKLGIIKLRKEDGRHLCSSIEKMRNLLTLDITSLNEDEIIDLSSLSSPPSLLKGLYLKGRLQELPAWISTLSNLSKLSLRWSRLMHDPLEALQALPNLVELQLLQAYEGQVLNFKAGGFQKVESLKLDNFKGLKTITFEWGAMPHLRQMSILRCGLLTRVPYGIHYLLKLEHLRFFDMPDAFTKTLVLEVQGYDHWKVKDIPEVYFIYEEEGHWAFYRI